MLWRGLTLLGFSSVFKNRAVGLLLAVGAGGIGGDVLSIFAGLRFHSK